MIWSVVKAVISGMWDTMVPGPTSTLLTPSANDNFERAFRFVQKWEGGSKITNDPKDPGGLTKYGISKRSNPDLDIANLTEAQAKNVYKERYWDEARCNTLPWPMCLAVFDTAVNMGVAKAVKAMRDNPSPAVYLDRREETYLNLVRKDLRMKRFIKGWLNRLNDLRKACGL